MASLLRVRGTSSSSWIHRNAAAADWSNTYYSSQAPSPNRQWSFESLRAILLRTIPSGSLALGGSLHSLLIKCGSCHDAFFANNLVSFYAGFGRLDDAGKMFEEMPHRSVVSWTSAISAFTRAGEPEVALDLFRRMLAAPGGETAVQPNGHTLSAALKACALTGDLEFGRWIHRQAAGLGLTHDTVLMNAALDLYVKCGSPGEARSVFGGMGAPNLTSWNTMLAGLMEADGDLGEAEWLFLRMPQPDVVSFNTIIAGFSRRDAVKALDYVHQMHKAGFLLNEFTFPCALKACATAGLGDEGKQLHCPIIKCGHENDYITGSALIDMYSSSDMVGEAEHVYNGFSGREIQGITGLLGLSNSMVSSLVDKGRYGPALRMVSQIYHSGGAPVDPFTLSSAVKACVGLHNLRLGVQAHAISVVSGHHLHFIVGSVLIDLYMKCGDPGNGLKLFDILPERDIVCWGGLLAGCVQHGWNEHALSMFKDMMMAWDVEIDHFVLSSVLKACAALSGLSAGKQVHGYCVNTGHGMETTMSTSLIDMYSKCGEIGDSLNVFRTANARDVLCWTGIIVGCGQNGRAKDAIQLFEEMVESGVTPNEVTYLAVLSACRHAGLVEEACSFFKKMSRDHGVAPSIEHYSCIVDVLCRADMTEEASRLMKDMPCEADETVWNAVVAADGITKSAAMGRLAAEKSKLTVLCKSKTSRLVSMSNNYARLGSWDNLVKIRRQIKEIGPKEAGVSWVQVEN